MSVNTFAASPMPSRFEVHDQIGDVLDLDLTGTEMRVWLHLAAQMTTGNRVPISASPIAAEIGVSRTTVSRAVATLRAMHLLLDPDDGLAMINPLYVVHNAAERDQLVARFATPAASVDRAELRRAARRRPHLSLVQ